MIIFGKFEMMLITDDKYIVNKIQDMVIMIIEEFGNYDGLHYDVDLSIFKN